MCRITDRLEFGSLKEMQAARIVTWPLFGHLRIVFIKRGTFHLCFKTRVRMRPKWEMKSYHLNFILCRFGFKTDERGGEGKKTR